MDETVTLKFKVLVCILFSPAILCWLWTSLLTPRLPSKFAMQFFFFLNHIFHILLHWVLHVMRLLVTYLLWCIPLYFFTSVVFNWDYIFFFCHGQEITTTNKMPGIYSWIYWLSLIKVELEGHRILPGVQQLLLLPSSNSKWFGEMVENTKSESLTEKSTSWVFFLRTILHDYIGLIVMMLAGIQLWTCK